MNPPYTIDNEPEFAHHRSFLSELTCREWAILLYMADDLLNAEIATHLNLTEKSVENYHTRISQKLNLSGLNKLWTGSNGNGFIGKTIGIKARINHLAIILTR